jgi:hypothetical protein
MVLSVGTPMGRPKRLWAMCSSLSHKRRDAAVSSDNYFRCLNEACEVITRLAALLISSSLNSHNGGVSAILTRGFETATETLI